MKNLALLAVTGRRFPRLFLLLLDVRHSLPSAGYRTETRQVKTCGYDIVTEEVVTPGDSKSGKGGMVQTIEKKVPRYKTVTKKVRISVRFLHPLLLPEKGLLRHHFRVHHAHGQRPRLRRQPEHRSDSDHETAASRSGDANP